MTYKQALFRIWLVFSIVWIVSAAPSAYERATSFGKLPSTQSCSSDPLGTIKAIFLGGARAGCAAEASELLAALGVMILPPILLLGLARAGMHVTSESEAA